MMPFAKCLKDGKIAAVAANPVDAGDNDRGGRGADSLRLVDTTFKRTRREGEGDAGGHRRAIDASRCEAARPTVGKAGSADAEIDDSKSLIENRRPA